MPEKDPTTYTLLTYAWVIGLSVWSGVAGFISKLRSGKARPFNFSELAGDIIISGLAGLLTFYLAEAAEINPLITAALVGVAGHMGSRAIALMEDWATAKFGK